jgi:hypothetical protein
MLTPDDEFDLDVRLTVLSDDARRFIPMDGQVGLFAGPPDENVTLAIDCGPTNDCTRDCWTAGCNTSETCDNPLCGSDAITLGSYCVDDSGGDDTCMACGGGGDIADPPDVDPTAAGCGTGGACG